MSEKTPKANQHPKRHNKARIAVLAGSGALLLSGGVDVASGAESGDRISDCDVPTTQSGTHREQAKTAPSYSPEQIRNARRVQNERAKTVYTNLNGLLMTKLPKVIDSGLEAEGYAGIEPGKTTGARFEVSNGPVAEAKTTYTFVDLKFDKTGGVQKATIYPGREETAFTPEGKLRQDAEKPDKLDAYSSLKRLPNGGFEVIEQSAQTSTVGPDGSTVGIASSINSLPAPPLDELRGDSLAEMRSVTKGLQSFYVDLNVATSAYQSAPQA